MNTLGSTRVADLPETLHRDAEASDRGNDFFVRLS